VTPPVPLQVVCCWCVPPHVLSEGALPASHTMCPAVFARELAAMDAEDAKDAKDAR